jgi:tripartite ATP-independent transporter DctP family solute receptor
MQRLTGPLFSVLCLAALAGSATAETTLRFAHTQPTADTHHAAALHFKERVEALTNGEVKISVHPAGELGNDPAVLEGVRLGTIDIGNTGNPFFTRFEPRLNALDLPYLFASYDHAYRVIDGPIGKNLIDGLEKHRMQPLAFWEIGFRNVTNSRRAVHTPKDLEGLKIRTTPNPAHVQAFKIMGAIPTPMPFTEVYLALESGTVDGQENPLSIIYSNRFHEVQKHLSMTRHAYTVSITVMNQQKFRSLSEAHQKIVLDAAKEAAQFQRELNRKADTEALEAIRKAGVEVVENVDTQPFQAMVLDPVKASYVKDHGSEIIDQIIAAGR